MSSNPLLLQVSTFAKDRISRYGHVLAWIGVGAMGACLVLMCDSYGYGNYPRLGNVVRADLLMYPILSGWEG